MDGDLVPFRKLMQAGGQSEAAIRAFEAAYSQLTRGQVTVIAENALDPLSKLPALQELKRGRMPPSDVPLLLRATVVIKLNGGLGTGMGLERAKSLLPVREGWSFLDLIARQILHLRQAHGVPLRFLLMSSFATLKDTAEALRPYSDLGPAEELQFLQSRIPKVDAATLAPARSEDDPDLGWCPPGHGDLYPSLLGSGRLQTLLDAGVRYAFLSNSDNLGATLDLDLLHHFVQSGRPLLMEVTRRTAADRKGGHLAVDRKSGRLLLREAAQCAEGDLHAFQDIQRHRYFNTNNLWLRLDLIKQALDSHGGFLPLPVIRNLKHLDPRDESSPEVIQLESAMGAAIATLENAGAIEVDRTRFAPVKTTDDLFTLRSDAYVLTEGHRLELHPARRRTPPNIVLDSAHYKLLDQLDHCLAHAVPSLLACDRLEIRGPVQFAPGVVLRGNIEIENLSSNRQPTPPRTIHPGTYESQVITFH